MVSRYLGDDLLPSDDPSLTTGGAPRVWACDKSEGQEREQVSQVGLRGVCRQASSARPLPTSNRLQVFERRCQGCHGGTAVPADHTIASRLDGIVGSKAGTWDYGVHSRAVMDSGIGVDRHSCAGFCRTRRRSGALMAVRVADPAELENLLDYLESLR